MTISAWDIYWITRLDNIQEFLLIIGSITLIASVILGIFLLVSNAVDELALGRATKKPFFITTIVAITFLGISCFIPTTKEMAAIVVLPKVVNSDFVQEKLPKEMNALYELTKNWLTEKTSKCETKN